jgi:hypothetical protein
MRTGLTDHTDTGSQYILAKDAMELTQGRTLFQGIPRVLPNIFQEVSGIIVTEIGV